MSTYTKFIVLFLTLFVLLMMCDSDYFNPPGMLAPWIGGLTCRVDQGNFGRFNHNVPEAFYAWDFKMPMGTPVLAVANGTPAKLGYKDDGYGNRIEIRHANGSYSLYTHLSSLCVSLGVPVVRGEVIGYSGATGYATGPHLHFSIMNQKDISLPSMFSDIGVPIAGAYYTSQNWMTRDRY